MSETKKNYKVKKKLMSDTFAVPKKLLSRLNEAGDVELKMFLIMASLGEDSHSEEELTAEFEKAGISPEELAEGFAFLRGAGLIEKASAKKSEKTEKTAVPKKEEPAEKTPHLPTLKPAYTSKQLAEAAETGNFKGLLEWASQRLGKTFNTSDVATLYSFKEYLCLPEDVIMLGIEHCVSAGKPSLRYIEKLLIDFSDRGIDTYQKAETYILKRREYLSFESEIRRMLGIGQRALTSREKAIVGDWQTWQMPDELIKLAYEKTVNTTKSASMSYMNKILEGWHSAGFKTVAEAEGGAAKPTSSAFDPDDFFRTAVESTKK